MSEFELNNDDVMALHPEDKEENTGSSFNRELFQMKHIVDTFEGSSTSHGWLKDGFCCHVLRPGEKWQRGRILLRPYFVPDEPETSDSDSEA